jgi:hypothetical protein
METECAVGASVAFLPSLVGILLAVDQNMEIVVRSDRGRNDAPACLKGL